MPGVTIRVFIPRRRKSRFGFALMNRVAADPKRAVNFAQPVCGKPLTSRIAEPTWMCVPAGRFSLPIGIRVPFEAASEAFAHVAAARPGRALLAPRHD